MIHYDYPQGSDAWLRLRCGIPTASKAELWYNANKGELRTARGNDDCLAQGAETYAMELLAEWMTGYPQDDAGQSQYMGRGSDMEIEARAAYELQTGSEVKTAGFHTLDDGSFGCSIDGLVGDDGLVEIKCFGLKEQLRAFIFGTDRAWLQIQCQLFVTGREWCDRWLYNPNPKLCSLARLGRYEKFTEFAQSLERFVWFMDIYKDRLKMSGIRPASPFNPDHYDLDGNFVGAAYSGVANKSPDETATGGSVAPV